MPEIRSITYFSNLAAEHAAPVISVAGDFLQDATNAFEKQHIVQTRRMATQPFPQGFASVDGVVDAAQTVYALCQQHGIDYLSLGPVSHADNHAYVPAIADIFRVVPGVFATVNMADAQHGIIPDWLMKTAMLIDEVSRITDDGMTNLYLAALANCPPGSPFFPVAYHDGGEAAFAIAIQAADLAVQAFRESSTAREAGQRLTQLIQQTADSISIIANQLAESHGIRLLGLDFSLAPFPVDEQSLGGALEGSGHEFGAHGLVGAAALVMSAVEAAEFQRVGFSGLMIPILEDSVLARRAAEGRLQMNDLLLLSAICGTGLDCVPLPGDIGPATLRDILLDVSALALRLNKPLTARLMPFPGKNAGDDLTFDFPYFANSRVLESPRASTSLWSGNSSIRITVRR